MKHIVQYINIPKQSTHLLPKEFGTPTKDVLWINSVSNVCFDIGIFDI